VLALSAAGAAQAQVTALYGGGATTGEKVYRNIFNGYGSTAGGDLCVGLASCPAAPYRSNVEVLYVGTGSSNGIKTYDAYNPATFVSGSKTPDNPPVASTRDFGPYYGSGTGSGWVPSSSATNYFPRVTFASGDGLAAADEFTEASLGFGPPIQVPSLVTPIAFNFTPTPGWNPKGTLYAGGSSKVSLLTNVVCGIFTGAITNWNSAEIKASNKNVQLGSGTITVVYRHDGAATTFFLSNGLLNQCGSSSFPISTHPVPEQWLIDAGVTDKNGSAVTASSDAGPPYRSNNSFYINVFNAGHLPANFYNNSAFSGVTGGVQSNSGMELAVDATVGAIGYIAPDFAQPILTGNDKNGNPVAAAANLQTWHSFSAHLTPLYAPPAPKYANYIMQSATPPAFTCTPAPCQIPAVNPLNWGPVNPTPTATNAYPIGGFQYFFLYSCYSNATTLNALASTTAGSLGLFRWYYGTATENSSVPANDLAASGYSAIPAAWAAGVKKLLFSYTATRLGTPKKLNTACAAITKGA
jgi:ABC-type phosphate transport system substrate-binding protein